MADQKKAIEALTDEIKVREAELEKIAGDVARANEAIDEARLFQAKIVEVSRKRGEAKALAFVEGRKADTEELDRQERELERLSKQAIEDSAAATIAIELLNKQADDIRANISSLVEQRRQIGVVWLEQIRNAAIDRYVKVLVGVGAYLAEAFAADRAISRLQHSQRATPGIWLHAEMKKLDLPVPMAWMVESEGQPPGWPRMTPLEWKRDFQHGKGEYEKILAEMVKLSLIPSDGFATGLEQA